MVTKSPTASNHVTVQHLKLHPTLFTLPIHPLDIIHLPRRIPQKLVALLDTRLAVYPFLSEG